jgi:exonuclease III
MGKNARGKGSNVEVNENKTWGDDPKLGKKGCRILFQNINGMCTRHKAYTIKKAIQELEIDIVGMAETNKDWNNEQLKSRCKSIFKEYWKPTRIGMTSSEHRFDSDYQPGGNMMITGYPWASQTTIRKDESGLGRWVESEISGGNGKKVTVVTAYCVRNYNIKTCGRKTVFAQQWHILKKREPKTNPNPRKKMMIDLGERLRQIKAGGSEIILMMDANDSLQEPTSHLTGWVGELNLIDVHTQYHCTDDEPPTHSRGSKRIDYILTTENLVEYVTASGILPLRKICRSDHRGLYIDIGLKEYLGGTAASVLKRAERGVTDEKLIKSMQGMTLTAKQEKLLPGKSLSGLSVVFTGRMTLTHLEAQKLANEMGAKSSPRTISKSTGLLVTGVGGGKKLDQAVQLGLRIIDADEFMKMVENFRQSE